MSARHPSPQETAVTDADLDLEYAEQQIALRDTIAWDDIYVRACQRARATGFAQLILDRGPANYC